MYLMSTSAADQEICSEAEGDLKPALVQLRL